MVSYPIEYLSARVTLMGWFYQIFSRWGFKPAGVVGWRTGAIGRLFFTLSGGLLIVLGLLEFPRVLFFHYILPVVLVWNLGILFLLNRATFMLDICNLVLDCASLIILIRFTGQTKSPFIFVVYLWLMALFAANVRGKSSKAMIMLTGVGYFILLLGGYGGEHYLLFIITHLAGSGVFLLVTHLFATELLKREFDLLTGVYSRRTGMDLLNQWMHTRPIFMVSFVDLIAFKRINDQYGHFVGDEVLRELGKRFRTCVREDDIVFRYGGDEFIVVSGAPDLEDRIRMCFRQPILTSKGPIQIQGRLGTVMFHPGESMDTLIREAEEHAYYRKSVQTVKR